MVHHRAHVVAHGRQSNWLAGLEATGDVRHLRGHTSLPHSWEGSACNKSHSTDSHASLSLLTFGGTAATATKRASKPRTAHLNITQHWNFAPTPTPCANKEPPVPIKELCAHGESTYPAHNLQNGWETSAPANGKVWREKCIVWASAREQMGMRSCCLANRTFEQTDCTFTFMTLNWTHY